MSLPVSPSLREVFIRLTRKVFSFSNNRKAITAQLLAALLIYALCLQLMPRGATATRSATARTAAAGKQVMAPKPATSESFSHEAIGMLAGSNPLPATITDAVVSRHKPTLNSGRIEGSLRVLSGESFTINGASQITSDLYLPGSPAIQLSGAARYAGTINDGGLEAPTAYTISLSGGIDLPGYIHTNADPIDLPTDFPASIPAASGTRALTVRSQSDIAAIGSWQTVRDLSVNGNGLILNVPPGNYGTFTVNGNSRLNFTAGTYNFAHTFNLDGSASIQATGLVVLNVAQSLTVTSGALVLGSYTSPGDVRLNVLGPSVNVNGSSQIAALLRADNATVTIGGAALIRGQLIANSATLNGGKVIGSVWPAHSAGSMTTFGPRRFDRTTGPPNQYLEQFTVPAGATPPYTLHIQNGSSDGTHQVSSATVKLNGAVILSPSHLNQNVGVVDRTVTLDSANTLAVSLASVPGSYLIIDISGAFPSGDATPPIVAISSPVNNSTTTDSQIGVSGTASDPDGGASGVAHVYVNGLEASYDTGNNTWTIAGMALNIGANSIVVQAVDKSGNQTTTTVTVTRENPNQPPTVNAGIDQTFALPQTASLHGTVTDDGFPQGSTLLSSWSEVAGSGTVTFTNPNALDTNASFSLPGTYVLRLSAEDGALSNSDEVTITVQPQNQPPTVVAGPDQTIALPHAATLNGSATDDGLPDASILAITWNQVSGPGTTSFAESYLANTLATFSEPGTYVLRLSASDSELSSASELTVTVQPENQAPTVSAGPDQIVPLPAYAQLNGSAADDGWPAGSSLRETWTVVSGPAGVNIINPGVTVTAAAFGMAGTYVLRLTASDGELSTSDDLTITVDPQNLAPVVNAGPDHTITLPGQQDLNAVVNDDGWPRDSRVTISWAQVSGPATATFATPDAATTTVSFGAAGTYVLRLTASDSKLNTSDDVRITVIPENHPPVAVAGTDQTITLPNAASLSGSVTDDGFPFGSTFITAWTKVSGPGVVTFNNSTATATTATFSQPGAYVLRLTASDSQLSASDDLTILVAAENLSPIVNAGADQVVTPSCVASLSGTANDDGVPAGNPLALSWSKVSGPGAVNFTNSASAITTASFSAPGAYVLRLTATDSELLSSDDVAIKVSSPAVEAPRYFGPTAYLSFQGSPFSTPTFSYFYLENFEDHLFNAPGVTANAGGVTSVLTGPGNHDSVDADDGAVDSHGAGGDSYISSNGAAGIVFTFDANVLGQLPTHAGLVWTDGAGQVYFEAFDHHGVSMGLQGPFNLPDAVFADTTAEDRFLGAYNNNGISRMRVLNTVGGIEIDHLQYGFHSNERPIVNAGLDPNVVLPGSTVALNGIVSDDGLPACSPLMLSWSVASGPAPVSFAEEHVAMTAVTLGAAGRYVLRLTASDSELADFDELTVTVGTPDASGNDFWLMFPISNGSADTLTLLISGEAATTGTITAAGISFTQNFSVTPGTVTKVIVPSGVEQLLNNAVDNKGIHVTAQKDITIHGLNQRTFQTDGYLGLPVDVLGTEYITLGYKNGGVTAGTLFSLVATANNTTVDITPATDAHATLNGIDTIIQKAGVPYKINLNQGQTYQLENTINSGDLSGSIISASKPIAVFGGHQCANIPTNFVACNHLVEQLPSIDKWGTSFLTMPLGFRAGGDTFRFIASRDNTHVTINGVVVATLNRGQHDERILNTRNIIAADQPILVAQYSNSFFFDSSDGDPFMTLVPPTEQFLSSYTIATPATGFSRNYLNVIVPNEALTSFKLDGSFVPAGSFLSIGASGYSGAQLPISVGSHTVSDTYSFGASIYGYASFDTYGYPAGMSLSPIALAGRTTVTPRNGFGLPGNQTCLTATVRDLNNNPIPNAPVTFNVTGANSASATVQTIVSGQAQFCYTGANSGFDTIIADSSSGSDQASRYWEPLNQAPIANAGPDQHGPVTVCTRQTIPLQGSATDDGFPPNVSLTFNWTVISGPGAANFTNSHAASTTVSFIAAGAYVLRLTASDTLLSSFDDVQVIVDPAPVNLPPTVSAGLAQTISLGTNLIQNPSNEKQLVNGEIPDWIEAAGTTWTQAPAGTNNLPPSKGGASYFYTQSNGPAPTSVLLQDVDVASLPSGANMVFKGYVRVRPDTPTASGQITLEFINKAKNVSLSTLTFNPVTTSTAWQVVEASLPLPSGAAWVRVRLNSTGPAGENGAGFFDALSLRAAVNTATTKLLGSVSDDGLYCGTFTQAWSKVSGPGTVGFSDPTFAISNASFAAAGAYVLRLTANDSYLTSTNDVSIAVNAAATNLAPTISAGANQTITLPANSITLNGTITDDGLPQGINLVQTWSKVSGPGNVAFANASSLTTTASFGAAGSYVLRLTGDDSELTASSDVTITVNSAPINQAPLVNPGPNQTISLPTDTVTLNGTATDDGLPAGNTLGITWSKISGPGVVTFGNANGAITTAQFGAVGIYVLRLSVTDGAHTVSADVGVTLAPQNFAPSANAGTDQTVLLSPGAQLNGSASDDGLPAGSNLATNWTRVSGPGNVAFLNPNAIITGAQFSATGTYVLRLTAGDSQLTASDDVSIKVIDDVAPPAVAINAPTDGSSVMEPMLVTGSVSNGAWVLEYSLDSDDNQTSRVWTTFASGNGPVTDATLGTLDPTMMLNGLFDIRLSATDSYGQTARTWSAVVVERNLKIGNFTVSFGDLNIPVAGVPMEVTRTYDSRDKHVGDFGFGWTLGLHNIRIEKARVIGSKWFETVSNTVFPNYCLEPTGSHLVTITFPGGKVFKFEASVSPHCQQFSPIDGGHLTFTALPGTLGTLEVVGPSEFQVAGSIPGPVSLIGFGGGVDIFNSSLFKFTAEDGTAFVIDQRAGLQSIQDTNNNTVTVSAGGVVHSNGKSIAFNRDDLGRITSVIDPAGNAQTYTYDAAGDLVSYTDNENNTSTYTYDAAHRLLTIHDPRGIQPIRNDYDPAGRLISHTDGFGKVSTYLHDLPGRTETITDRLGHATSFVYDEHGNVLSKTDARGGVTTFTYDTNDNVLTETNSLGKTTTYSYDVNDQRTSVSDPLSHITEFTYNALGKLLTTTDPLGHVTTNTYNFAGNLLTTRDPLNNTTSFGYSVFDGQRTSMTDALTGTASYSYSAGYLTRETDALGHETTFTYDANGNRLSQTVKRTNAQSQLEVITTAYKYDKLNRLTKTTFADGSFTQVEYNSIGQQAATIDQLGYRTEFTYDEMGRLIKATYPDGSHEDSTYDAEGRRLTSKDRGGQLTSYTYDELGRLTKSTYADGTFTSSSYDPAGQVVTTTDARGNVTRYEYDDAGRRKKVKNAVDQETSFAYDANGNQLSLTDAFGRTTVYEYDLNNRRLKTIYADSTFDNVAFDGLGRSVSKTDQAGNTTHFTYDLLGRLTKVTDPLNQETTYGHNELGQQVSQTDANNHITRFEYDQLGRRVKRILPGGQFETYSYDDGGSLRTKTDFNGKITTFTYDVMRRLLSRIPDASLHESTVSFTYNTVGQRATMNDASGATVYTYDVRHRLANKQTPFGTLGYTYDDAGNLLRAHSSNANGVSVDYSYDALNRLATVKDHNLVALSGGLTNYSYDSVGNLQNYVYPNGVTTTYNYNSLNRLVSMNAISGGSTLASYSYSLGATGNRTAVTELSGRTVNYTYDDLYRLTNESIASDPRGINGSLTYVYDSVGNRLSRSSSLALVPSQAASYDANDRLTNDRYDNNGNTTGAGENTYGYDFENRITSLNGATVTYVYDGDGNRVAKTVGGLTTNYLVDTNNPTGYAQVVDELQEGAVVKSFTYGHDLISQRIVGSSLSFYGYDGHGSVRQLTDASGSVTDAYDYDAFGNFLHRSGTTPNDYLYSGEQFDANLGSYYLRARYMNPVSGRLWTMDSFDGGIIDPLSLHKYILCGNNSVNRVDPSGTIGIADSIGEINTLTWRATLFVGQFQRFITAGSLLLKALDVASTFGDTEYRDLSFTLGHNPFASLAALAGDARLAFRYSRIGAEIPYIAGRVSTLGSQTTIINAGGIFPERELINFTKWSANPTVVEEGEVLYRVHTEGRATGFWWTRVKPQSEIQFRIDSALRPEWNEATQVSTMTVPRGYGLQGWEGSASYQGGFYVGGGNQLFIPNVPEEWITTVPFK